MALGMTDAEVWTARHRAAAWAMRSGARRSAAVADELEALFAAWASLPNEILLDVRMRGLAKALERVEAAMEDDSE